MDSTLLLHHGLSPYKTMNQSWGVLASGHHVTAASMILDPLWLLSQDKHKIKPAQSPTQMGKMASMTNPTELLELHSWQEGVIYL